MRHRDRRSASAYLHCARRCCGRALWTGDYAHAEDAFPRSGAWSATRSASAKPRRWSASSHHREGLQGGCGRLCHNRPARPPDAGGAADVLKRLSRQIGRPWPRCRPRPMPRCSVRRRRAGAGDQKGSWWVVPALLARGHLRQCACSGPCGRCITARSRPAGWPIFSPSSRGRGSSTTPASTGTSTTPPSLHPGSRPRSRLVTSGTPRTWRQYLFRISSIPPRCCARDILLFPFGPCNGNVDYIDGRRRGRGERWWGRWLLAHGLAVTWARSHLQTDVLLWVWFIPFADPVAAAAALSALRAYALPQFRRRLCQHAHDAQQSQGAAS